MKNARRDRKRKATRDRASDPAEHGEEIFIIFARRPVNAEVEGRASLERG